MTDATGGEDKSKQIENTPARIETFLGRLERRAEHLRSRSARNDSYPGITWDRAELSALEWAIPELREKHGLPAPSTTPSIPASKR